MGQGYTRNDVSNNIDNGNIINADDLDGEFEAIDSAFTAGTGHTHDGTTGEGGPVTVVGPAQDVVVSGTSVLPKTTETLDLGSPSKKFKDAQFSGTVTAAGFAGPIAGAVAGNVTGDVTGDLTGNVTGNVVGNVTGNLTGNADTADSVNSALTIGAGLALSSGTTFDGSAAVTVSHADTSSQASVNNSSGTVVQDISVDTYGHITSIASTDLDALYAPVSHVGAGGGAHAVATTSAAGFMSASDKTKLNGIAAGAQVNVGTDLGNTTSTVGVQITSSTGANTTIAAATDSAAGVMTAADHEKLGALNLSTEQLTQSRFRAGDGSVSSPAFTFFDDTNTGFYRGADSRMFFAINGAIHGVIDTVDGGSNAKGLLTRDGANALYMNEATLDGLGVDGESSSDGTLTTITMPSAGFIMAWVTLHTTAINGVAIRLALSISGSEVNARSFTGNAGNDGAPLTITCYGILNVSAGARGISAAVTGTTNINLNYMAQGFCNG